MLVCTYNDRKEGEDMKNNFFSEDDDMRPFVVKKMNLPPAHADKDSDKQENKREPEDHSYNEDSRQRIIEEHVYEIPTQRRKSMFRSAKPLLISILSAITIGVILGFIVLRMGAGGTGATNNIEASQTPPPTKSTTGPAGEEEDSSSPTSPIELVELQAYVLQAGVYSERDNTDEVVSTFESHGYAPVVWEKDRQFYVFTHLFAAEEQAKEEVEDMEKSELETYAKSWITENRTVDMSEEEGVFIQEFVETWNETVEKHSNQETDVIGLWEQLVEEIPEEEGVLEPLTTYVTTEIEEAEMAIEMDELLLNTWILYEQIGE